MMMKVDNVNRDITPDSEPLRPEGVLKVTGEERNVNSIQGINDAVTLKPSGRVGADNPKDSAVRRNLWKSTLKLGTWNVRTMNHGNLDILTKELERNKVDLIGLAETRWTGKGHFTTDSKHVVYFSGKESRREYGVAFVANPHIAKCVLGYNPVNERMN